MTTQNQNQIKMDDLKAIEKCPELTEYVFKNRISSMRKTAIIVTIVASVVSLALGVFAGVAIANTSATNNVIEVKVNASEQVEAGAATVTEDTNVDETLKQ